jgi:hypothetical protein
VLFLYLVAKLFQVVVTVLGCMLELAVVVAALVTMLKRAVVVASLVPGFGLNHFASLGPMLKLAVVVAALVPTLELATLRRKGLRCTVMMAEQRRLRRASTATLCGLLARTARTFVALCSRTVLAGLLWGLLRTPTSATLRFWWASTVAFCR